MSDPINGLPHVLLVEHMPFDVRAFQRGVGRSQQPCRLTVAMNGEEALQALQGAAGHGPTPTCR